MKDLRLFELKEEYPGSLKKGSLVFYYQPLGRVMNLYSNLDKEFTLEQLESRFYFEITLNKVVENVRYQAAYERVLLDLKEYLENSLDQIREHFMNLVDQHINIGEEMNANRLKTVQFQDLLKGLKNFSFKDVEVPDRPSFPADRIERGSKIKDS